MIELELEVLGLLGLEAKLDAKVEAFDDAVRRARRCVRLMRRPPTPTGRRERERQDKACVYTPPSGPGSDAHFWAYLRAGRPPSMLGPWARDTVVWGGPRLLTPAWGARGILPVSPARTRPEGLTWRFPFSA